MHTDRHAGKNIQTQFLKRNIYIYLVFRDRVSLSSPGCPGTHSVDQAGLKLRNLPTSASQLLGLKVCTTTAWLLSFYCDKSMTRAGEVAQECLRALSALQSLQINLQPLPDTFP